MRKTEYGSVEELEQLFDWGMVKCTKTPLGTCESGITISSILDEKSGTLYLEQYEPVTATITVYSYEQGNHPCSWTLEENGNIAVTIS